MALIESSSETRGGKPALRLSAALATVVVVVLGIWVTGGLLTNDFSLAMVLTMVWLAAAGLAAGALVLRNRGWWPVLAAYLVAAGVAGIYLGMSTLLDDEVDESVVTAKPDARPDRPEPRRRAAAPANRLLAEGRFQSLEHSTGGRAQLIGTRRGKRVLTLTGFETDNGPDLRVYLSSPDADQGSPGSDYEDLGPLKGNKGDQQYAIPEGIDVKRLSKVVVWCRAFSVGFGAAELRKG